MQSVKVSAMGMVSALGHDVVSACAAARAGMSRAVELEGPAPQLDPQGELDPLRGHAVRESTFGFQGLGRLEALLHPALDDLAARLPAGEAPDGLYLAFGDRERYGDGAFGGITNEDLGRALTEVVVARLGLGRGAGGDRSRSQRTARASPACSSAPWTIWPRPRCGARWSGVVDSLVDEEAVDWLLRVNRLKTSLQPVGLSPGEAAAFLPARRGGRGRAAFRP